MDKGCDLRFPRDVELDPVTSLPPRKCFDADLPRLLGLLGRERLPLCALMIDIDHFKKFNDMWGHGVGDRVLGHVAGIIRSGVRYRGEAYRYGGEEITVMLPNSSREEGLVTANRLVAAVGGSILTLEPGDPDYPRGVVPADSGAVDLSVTISVGVSSTCDIPGSDLIVMADRALYEAKDSGRNRAVEYTPRLAAETRLVTVDVRVRKEIAVSENNQVYIRKWFPLTDATCIEARAMRVEDTNNDIKVGIAAPQGGLIDKEIPGRVHNIEKREEQTFFELAVKGEAFEVMVKHATSWKASQEPSA